MRLESFQTNRYRLDIEIEDKVGRVILTDRYSGVIFADSEYRYSAFAEKRGQIVRLEGLWEPRIIVEPWRRGGSRITISGVLGEKGANADVGVRHRLYIPEDQDFLEERLVLRNLGSDNVIMRGYRFGFRKKLDRPRKYGGPGIDIENYRIIAIPFRLQPDGKKHDYPLDEIYHGRFECSTFHNPARLVQEVVDQGRGRSEAWAWTDGENGLLIIKHNPDAIEFSMLDTERITPSNHLTDEAQAEPEVYLTFGGAAPSLYNEPIQARVLAPSAEFPFGKTRYQFYEGLWREGAYLFREFMAGLGHGVPEDYDPSIHWSSHYDIGRHHNNPYALAENYNPEMLEIEATKARDAGCDLLYLGPGWEVCEGNTTWDEARLGDPSQFVRRMKDDFGLKVGLRTIGRSYCDDWPGMYRRRYDGSTGFYAPYASKPFHEPCFCSQAYQEEKLRRIMKLADAGMSFIMLDEFDWRGPCHDPTHGHSVPTTPDMHARAVAELARKIHEKHPDIVIEMHDPIWPWGARYLPVYYLHDQEGSFNEVWGFEFVMNPLDDLLSGKALSLFYYNLAYSLPLYLHINMANDNDACLAFWWYASTVRHLGIGGKQGNEARFAAYRDAMARYRSLKALYTRGVFYGPDELTHIHVLPEEGECVVNAFNLTDTPVSREVEIRLNDLGLLEDVRVEGAPYRTVGGKLVLELEIPPFSPIVATMLRK
ncbi:MAG: hypothetical protein N3B12_08215 [Armatimonadetes bacterium]|nr:hypothetical protein [Armatimonadota bacterium]